MRNKRVFYLLPLSFFLLHIDIYLSLSDPLKITDTLPLYTTRASFDLTSVGFSQCRWVFLSPSGLLSVLAHHGVVWVSVGHDHGNDWCCPSPAGPTVCYGRHTGYGGYGRFLHLSLPLSLYYLPLSISPFLSPSLPSSLSLLPLSLRPVFPRNVHFTTSVYYLREAPLNLSLGWGYFSRTLSLRCNSTHRWARGSRLTVLNRYSVTTYVRMENGSIIDGNNKH